MASYPFTLPGYENIPFIFQPDGMVAKIFCDGKPLKQTRGKFQGILPNGEAIELKLKYTADIFSPKIKYKDQVLTVIPPLPKYQMILGYLPLVLVAGGGALGGLLGGGAAYFNLMTFRGNASVQKKVILSILSFLGAIVAYIILAGLVQTVLK